jgi:nitroreductase
VVGRAPAIEGVFGDIGRASIYGSILPAFWSFMLAARARGLGTAWTTLHLLHEQEVADLLGIPYGEIMQCALSPLAFTRGTDFRPAKGRSSEGVLHIDGW